MMRSKQQQRQWQQTNAKHKKTRNKTQYNFFIKTNINKTKKPYGFYIPALLWSPLVEVLP
jgi:hypothetical protein